MLASRCRGGRAAHDADACHSPRSRRRRSCRKCCTVQHASCGGLFHVGFHITVKAFTLGSILTSTSSTSGMIATVAVEVCTRPLVSVAGTRCTRCTPDSYLSLLYTLQGSERVVGGDQHHHIIHWTHVSCVRYLHTPQGSERVAGGGPSSPWTLELLFMCAHAVHPAGQRQPPPDIVHSNSRATCLSPVICSTHSL